MPRRRRPVESSHHERWLVSYADFITLLFALFVVLFASAQADQGRANRISESVRRALEDGQVAKTLGSILGTSRPGGKDGSDLAGSGKGAGNARPIPGGPEMALARSYEALRQSLRPEMEKDQVKIALEPRGLVISLREAAFFASGDDRVYPRAYAAIDRIARAIRPMSNPVRLEGHTDSFPIHNSRFRSNWELSAARSIAVMRFLVSRCGMPSSRMAVTAYADTMPVEPDDSAQGRLRNRRVDIVILSAAGAVSGPLPAGPAPVRR